jgi:hypothetical protein
LPDGTPAEPLTFKALDGIAFAAARGRLSSAPPKHVVVELGPLIEWLQLARAGVMPLPCAAPWLAMAGSEAFYQAVANGVGDWISPQGDRLGVFKCNSSAAPDEARWHSFQLEAHKAALAAGSPTQIVRRLMGAMGEIRDNVIEHSEAAGTGLIAFHSRPGSFEFAVADSGIGTLASLQTNPEYAGLRDEGEALQCALTDGESRFGKAAGRGTGFSQLFKSLTSLNASLRFRSGDHALSIEGKSPTLVNAIVAMKPRATGFMTSVRCVSFGDPRRSSV